MIADRDFFATQFSAALSRYLNSPDEESLNQAYELGRLAINEGFSVLDIGLMYQDVVASMPNRVRDARHFMQAAAFFFEALAPFEMMNRGYRDANEQLQEMTRRLEQQNRELASATAAAQAANKELEAFSYSVSHDLRAPVRHIAAFSEKLVQEHSDELQPNALRYLTIIQQSTQSMGQMIEGLLSLSRIDRQEVVRRPVDLNIVVMEVIRELERDLSGRAIEWQVEPLPTAACDPGLIKLVFANLLSNAVKYSRNRAAAVVRVGHMVDDRGSVIFVKDNGVGFDTQYADKLFGVFQRLHRAEEFEGTGVGLATVERILRKHGGSIWVEAMPDAGATFFFNLDSPSSARKTPAAG